MKVLANIRSAKDLRLALAARRREVGLKQRECDALIGLADAHLSKLECGIRGFGDVTLPAVLAALGCELTLTESPGGLPATIQRYLDAPRPVSAHAANRSQGPRRAA